MDFFAFLAVLVGAYLIDSVVKGRPPVTTIRRIFENPSKISEILDETRGTSEKLNTGGASSSATSGGGENPSSSISASSLRRRISKPCSDSRALSSAHSA